MGVPMHRSNDLMIHWDHEGSRYARVLAMPGRLEIRLCESDPEWVQQALDILDASNLQVVLACAADD